MKYAFILFCAVIYSLNSQSANAQQNTVGTGGTAIGSGGSVSYSIGQLDYITASGSGGSASQGMQQVFKVSFNLKAYIQGYYEGSGLMKSVLANQGQVNGLTDTDTLTIELHLPNPPYAMAHSYSGIIKTDGTITCAFLNANEGLQYYVVVKHRNSLETWSAAPITLFANTNYDFTTNANKAFGNNQFEVEPNVWAFYSGDINTDENIDLLDLAIVENDISNFQFGYLATDINGDGNVDLLDSTPVEVNATNFVFSLHP